MTLKIISKAMIRQSMKIRLREQKGRYLYSGRQIHGLHPEIRQRSGTRGLAYGEKVCEKGLNLLSAPGNDLVASTALAAAGAHIILFTTGRGTPLCFSCAYG